MYKALLQRPILNGFFSVFCLLLGSSIVAVTLPESLYQPAGLGMLLACFIIPGSCYGTYFKEKMPKMTAFLYCLTLLGVIFVFAFAFTLLSPEVSGDLKSDEFGTFVTMLAIAATVFAAFQIGIGYMVIRKTSGSYAKRMRKLEVVS